MFELSNIILGVGDPEYGTTMESLMTAAVELSQYAQALGEERVRHAARRHHQRAHAGRRRRRPADDGRVRVVLHPAGRRRQRDHAQRDQPWHEGAHRLPRAAPCLDGRLRGPRADGGGGDRALGDAGDPLPPNGDARRGDRGPGDPRGREGRHVVQLGQPRRARVRRSLPLRRDAASRTSTSASAAAARTSASAPTWPGARSR